jgi:FkbM family methyltransferase
MSTLRPRIRRAALTVAIALLLNAAPAFAVDDSLLTSGQNLYSEKNEELIIRHFFQDRREGFFLDVGCFEWKDLSTTYYLEKHLGWKGFSIDANPALAPGYAENRPGTTFFNYLVTDHTGDQEVFYLSDGLEVISSASESWILEMYRLFAPEVEPKISEVKVPTTTLNEMLDRNGVTKIDFLSLDIEGHEPQALAGFEIERFLPELVCVELSGNSVQLSKYFESHNYERIEKYLKYDAVNWYYRPKPKAPQDEAPSAKTSE